MPTNKLQIIEGLPKAADDVKAVSYDVVQTLTDEQKAQARDNIGAQETLTFDTAPTADSTNPVTSGGIYTILHGSYVSTDGGGTITTSGDGLTGPLTIEFIDDIEDTSIVTTFNNRTGAVQPASGDYTAEMVGASPSIHASQHAGGGSDPITPADIGAVKKSGDTMTGNLFIKKSAPEMDFKNTNLTDGRLGYILMGDDNTFNFGNYLDRNNRQTLYIQPETNELRSAVKFLRCIDGTTNYYCLYGEHNKPTATDVGALPLSGGTMTGEIVQKNLKLTDGVNTRVVITAYDDGDTNNYGSEMTISSAGNMFVGSGESPTAMRTDLQTNGAKTNEPTYSKSGEVLYLSSDGGMVLSTNANTIANRKSVQITTAGALMVPLNTDYSSYKTRNIAAGTTDLTAGSSTLGNGNIYLVYE